MVAETARSFDALEAQAALLTEIFTTAGFEHVAPAIIQPADTFLDVVGEAIRGRTYVFSDPEGVELCLRPDLTVPTCRLYLERNPSADRKARYCYNGPAFRYQPGGISESHPREFRQAGIEAFGDTDRERIEVEVVALALKAIDTAGLKNYRIRFGDLGIFHALLEAIKMPARWRLRLAQSFWRKESFRAELNRLSSHVPHAHTGAVKELIERLVIDDPEQCRLQVEAFLDAEGVTLIGNRTLTEIVENLAGAAADLREKPLDDAAVSLLESYVSIKAPPRAAGARIRDLMSEHGIDITQALDTYSRRIELLGQKGVKWADTEFSAEFGRNLEYYTGFVFQIEVPVFGEKGHIAGGGRYDGLLEAVGAPVSVPGVGLAIHTERLLGAVAEGL